MGRGLLPGVDGKKRCTQGLSRLSGLCVVDEIATCIALRQQVMPLVVDFNMRLKQPMASLMWHISSVP